MSVPFGVLAFITIDRQFKKRATSCGDSDDPNWEASNSLISF